MSPQAIRVAIVGGDLGAEGGGAALSTRRLADVHRSVGLVPSLYALSGDRTAEPEPAAGGTSIASITALLATLEATPRRFDLVHLNGPNVAAIYRVADACRRRSVPWIYSPRGIQAILRREAPHSAEARSLARLDAEIMAGAAAVHFTSRIERRLAGSDLAAVPILTIPNPVDLDGFDPPDENTRTRLRTQLRLSSQETVHLAFARIAAEKNLDFLVELAARTDTRAGRFFFVGPEVDDTGPRLRRRAMQLGIADRIVFPGAVQGVARRDWPAVADVMLVPSQSENFCLSLVEALAAGVRVLATPDIGALEYFPADYAVVRPLDVDIWARALAEAPRPPMVELRRRHRAIAERFSIATIAREWRSHLAAIAGPQ